MPWRNDQVKPDFLSIVSMLFVTFLFSHSIASFGRELLIAFRRSTGLKPDRIIFYRSIFALRLQVTTLSVMQHLLMFVSCTAEMVLVKVNLVKSYWMRLMPLERYTS